MMKKTRKFSRSIATLSLLTGFIGVIGFRGQSFATPNTSSLDRSQNIEPKKTSIQTERSNNILKLSLRENTSDRAVISQRDREVENLQEGMLYEEARELLIQQGWQPNLQGEPPNLTDVSVGNLFRLGYEEVKDCSGTGEAPCRFEFINERGELLVVVAIPQGSPNWFIKNWWIEQWGGSVLPFVGTRAFNFLGGTGTGHTITIAEDGRTTIEIHGTAGSTVIYQGEFSNPLSVESGLGLLLKDDQIYQLSPDGEIATDCKGQGTICEAKLYELEFRP